MCRSWSKVVCLMEPSASLGGVTDVSLSRTDPRVRDLYAAAYPRLVRALALVCGGKDDAEEAVQEAFVRLLTRWSTVGGYDDPEAWVRLVAFRLAVRRRRRT